MASEHSGQGSWNRLLAALTSEDHSLLAPHLQELSLKLGSALQVPDKPIEYVYFPHQGMISLLAVMSDGQGIETATVGSEGVVGAMSGFGIRPRISCTQFQAAVQKSEALKNLRDLYT